MELQESKLALAKGLLEAGKKAVGGGLSINEMRKLFGIWFPVCQLKFGDFLFHFLYY